MNEFKDFWRDYNNHADQLDDVIENADREALEDVGRVLWQESVRMRRTFRCYLRSAWGIATIHGYGVKKHALRRARTPQSLDEESLLHLALQLDTYFNMLVAKMMQAIETDHSYRNVLAAYSVIHSNFGPAISGTLMVNAPRNDRREVATSMTVDFARLEINLKGQAGTRLRQALNAAAIDGDLEQALQEQLSGAVYLAWLDREGHEPLRGTGSFGRRAASSSYIESERLDQMRSNVATAADIDDVAEEEADLASFIEIEAMRQLARDARLSTRERDVFEFMLQFPDATDQEIADMLGISRGTVKSLTSRIRKKLRAVA